MKAKIISNTRIAQVLGKGTSRQSIISSAAIVFTSFFYIFTAGSYFKVPIYLLHSRVVTKLYFTDVYIISKYVDHVLIVSGIVLWLIFSVKGNKERFATAVVYGGIAAIGILTSHAMFVDFAAIISIPLVICFLFYDRLASRILNTNTKLYVNYFSILGMAIGIVAIIILSALPLFSISSTPIPNYAYGIFVLFSSFSPVLMFLLINAVPLKLLTIEGVRGVLKIKNGSSSISNDKIKLRNKVIYLSLIVLLAVTLVVIPHQPTVNKNNRLIGTDSKNYVVWENILMKSNNFLQFVRNAFVILDGGNRPITLMFLFTVIKLVPSDPYFTIDHIPIILGPALALAIYFLTRELTSNDIASLLAAFLTIVSFHTLVGLYAGYYANWFALIIGYLSFVFLFRFLKTSNKLNVVIYFLLLVLTLFTHSYTWTILTMVAGIFLLVMLKFNYYYKKCIILVLLVTVFTVVIDIAKFAITSSPGGIEQDVNVASIYTVGVGQLPVRWNNLIDTTEIYYGAAFSNVIILTLGLYWLFRSCIREQSTIFVMIFLSLGILPLFFGNWLVQSRVFYNIPFQIPAAIALVYIKKQTNGTIMLVPICIWLISMAVSAVSNFA